jgi:hypothetical protein
MSVKRAVSLYRSMQLFIFTPMFWRKLAPLSLGTDTEECDFKIQIYSTNFGVDPEYQILSKSMEEFRI